MTITYWILFGIGSFSILAILIALNALVSHFKNPMALEKTTQSLSVIVPIKGSDETTEENLTALVTSELDSKVEFLFAMEEESDSAFKVCSRVKKLHSDIDISIIITGDSDKLMGKQHNINVASKQAKYDYIASMDADVRITPQTIKHGLNQLTDTNTGVVYFLPFYNGKGTSGGNLLTTYINHFYNLIFTYFYKFAKQPTIIGALWIVEKKLLDECGGIERLAGTVSDDRELGVAIAELGHKNTMVPYTVLMPSENLTFNEGISHLSKWFGMVRAEGILVYILFALFWGPMISAVASLLIAFQLDMSYVFYSSMLLVSILLLRSITVFVLNKKIYNVKMTSNLITTLLFDALLFPFLLIKNVFNTSIVWKGKKYKLGKQGKIMGVEKV
jgi:cellulose synthase/poly-beta-1,6-N-acetylglucosamine synthase-like glycosyltransferase